MTSLRASIATLQRFSPAATLNISDVARFLLMERPVSVNDLITRIASLPETVPFHSTIVTDTALGGEVSIVLNRDGSYRFSGFMRATGLPSFSFRIGVVIRSMSGQVAVALPHSGKVFGTDTPGDRQCNWDEVVTDPKKTSVIRTLWPDISGGKMVVTCASDLSGALATVGSIVKDAVEFFVAAQTLGASIAVCLVIGSELGEVGADIPGLGGVVGLGIVGGALFIWGPLAIGPAIILGVAAGAIVDAMVKIRRLSSSEEDFVREVFGDSLDFERIRITNLLGLGGAPFTVPTVDDHILVNIGVSDAMFDAPATTGIPGYETSGQLLIHELVHAWQVQHNPLGRGYVPGWLCEGIREQVFIGDPAYDYGPAGPPWESLHIEAQAHIVDEWFAGTGRQSPASSLPAGVSRQMNPNSPYFGYINNNIRAAVA